MKNLYLLSVIILFYACTDTAPKAVESVERSIGFHSNDELKEFRWHLGTEEPIDLVKALDKAWIARDYVAMKNYFVDTLTITTYDGKIFKSFEDFQQNVAMDTAGGWTFDRAYSVDLNPALGGEHVQAFFNSYDINATGDTTRARIYESYYVVNQKIIWLNQFRQEIK
jgi:hypothetical protein